MSTGFRFEGLFNGGGTTGDIGTGLTTPTDERPVKDPLELEFDFDVEDPLDERPVKDPLELEFDFDAPPTALSQLLSEAEGLGLDPQDIGGVINQPSIFELLGQLPGLSGDIGIDPSAQSLSGLSEGDRNRLIDNILVSQGISRDSITDIARKQVTDLLTASETSLGALSGQASDLFGQSFLERRTGQAAAEGVLGTQLGAASRSFGRGQQTLQAGRLQQQEAIRTRQAGSGFAGAGVFGQAGQKGLVASREASQDLFGGLTAQRGAAQTAFGSTTAALQTGLLGSVGDIGTQIEGQQADVLSGFSSGLGNLINQLISTG